MHINFKKIVEENKEYIIQTLQELIRINTEYDSSTITEVMPFGKGINDSVKFMENLALKDGFDCVNDDGYALEINYGKSGKTVGILCHLDVVPAGKGWTYPPYEGKIVDNKIYGRGTTDDKGPLIATYFALKFIKDANIKLKNQIKFILGTDEETSWRGINHYLKSHPLPDFGFSPDCSFPLVYGEKGRMAIDLTIENQNKCAVESDAIVELKGGDRYNVVIDEAYCLAKIDLSQAFNEFLQLNKLEGDVFQENNLYRYEIKGLAAHAMEPEKGRNAGTYLCDFFKEYTNNQMIKYIADVHHKDHFLEKTELGYTDFEMGPLTCNIGIIDLNHNSSRVTLDIRYPERFKQEDFIIKYQKLIKEYSLKITEFSHKSPHYVSPNSKLVKVLYDAYCKNTQDYERKPFTVGGGTYASIMPKGVAYGMGFPYEEELAHQKNEFINIDSLLKGILIYIDAIIAVGELDA